MILDLDKKKIIILISISILFLIVGFLFGKIYQIQKGNFQLEYLISSLNSDVIPSIISYGKVTEINGRNITIAFNDSLIVVYVKEDIPIYKINGRQEEINFEQIKVGDELNVELKINIESENFEAESVINFSKN